MPFRRRNGYAYNPEALAQLQAIFNDVWNDIAEAALATHTPSELQDEIAKRIMAAEQKGLGPEAIRELVLQQFGNESSTGG